MRNCFARLAGFLVVLLVTGCTSKEEKSRQEAATHLAVAEDAVDRVTKGMKAFADGVKGKNVKDAKDALETLKATFSDCKAKANALPADHSWLTVQEMDRKIKSLLAAGDFVVIPEMGKIVSQMEAGKTVNEDPQIQESLGKIGDAVAGTVSEVDRLIASVKLEVSIRH